VIIFGLVQFLSKKNNQIDFFKKNTETGSNRFDTVFLVWLGFFIFFGFARFFSRSAQFFSGLGSIRFFWFQAYKTKIKPNRSVFLKF
jgi:ATP-dependent Zn protease